MSFKKYFHLRTLKFRLLVIATVGLASCRPSSSTELKFIGGEIASGQAYNALLWLPNCTGVLISPKTIATAAHCVHIFAGANAGQISSRYAPGSSITIGNTETKDSTSDVAETVTIEKTIIHPTWDEACTKESPCGQGRGAAEKNPGVYDIALINITKAITGIPFALVDFTEVKPNDDVILTGYGCEDGINTGRSGRKKIHPIKVAEGKTALSHEGSERKNVVDKTLSANFVTPGGKDSSLCPGDSGGPVFRGLSEKELKQNKAGQEVTVKFIGINADYTFKGQYEQEGAIPETNIHTRIDTPEVKDWILKHAIDLKQNVSNDIFLAAEHTNDSKSDDHFKFHISTLPSAESVIFCWIGDKKCDKDSTSEFTFTKKNNRDQRSFFETSSNEKIEPKGFTVIALDKEKKVLSKDSRKFVK